jgi:hypothetical protein
MQFFPLTAKNRPGDPSEIRALEFKGEFRRSAICSISGTIGIDRSIFRHPRERGIIGIETKNTFSACSLEQQTAQDLVGDRQAAQQSVPLPNCVTSFHLYG